MHYFLCVLLSYGFWYSLRIDSLHKSTIHSLVSLLFSFCGLSSNFVFAVVSSGYYLDDLRCTKNIVYIFHHIFSVYMLSLCYPEKFLSRVMMIEGSVPFLNYYISIDNTLILRKLISLFVYFCSHVYFRNFLLYRLYNELYSTSINVFNIRLIQLFILFNFWWTFTTFRKTCNLLKKFILRHSNND